MDMQPKSAKEPRRESLKEAMQPEPVAGTARRAVLWNALGFCGGLFAVELLLMVPLGITWEAIIISAIAVAVIPLALSAVMDGIEEHRALIKAERAVPPPPPQPLQQTGEGSVQMPSSVGMLITILGAAIMLFFALAYSTAVDTDAGGVNNLGLMNNRITGIIFGGFLSIIGVIVHIGARMGGTIAHKGATDGVSVGGQRDETARVMLSDEEKLALLHELNHTHPQGFTEEELREAIRVWMDRKHSAS